MNTINITDNAQTLVNKLNANFNEAGSGSISAVDHIISMQMQGGIMENGYIKENISTDSQFFNYCHTVLMLGIENCKVKNVAVDSNETLTIFYYGLDGTYIGSTTSVSSIPTTAYFVKFMVKNTTAYASLRTPLLVTVQGKPSLVKNKTPELVTSKYFSFETSMPAPTDIDTNVYVGTNARVYDNGFIKLPPNYTIDGAPVPLVVYVHGTSGYGFSDGASGTYAPYHEFIANNGYAICDCSGLTNIYKGANAFGAPSFVSSIVNMVKYLTNNYNIKDDGVYLFGKSSGGFIVHMLTETQSVKIKAAGSLAPALSPMVSMSHHARTYNSAANVEAQQIGITETISSSFTDTDKALILDNIKKWKQIDAFFTNTDLTDEQIRTIVNNCYNAGGQHRNITDIADNTAILDNAKRWIYCPLKIWIAKDDYVVYHGNSKMYVDMAQRAGCQCYLRSMPSGTGAHHAVDRDENAIKVNYTTKYAGTVEIPVAFAELVDWFNRW